MHYKRQDIRDHHRDHHISHMLDGMVLDIYGLGIGDIGHNKDEIDAR